MKACIIRIVLCTAMFLIGAALARAAEPANADRTLSPYFHVESQDESADAFPLKGTDVTVNIGGVIADVTVTQRYANTGATPISGRYIFPGSLRAAVHGMTMRIGERIIAAKIKEKGEARKTYEAAKRDGKSASLLEQHRPNVFSMEVANILPGDILEIELRYTELLTPTDSTYEFVYPAVVGPRYGTMAEATAPPSEQWVKNPYLKQGDDPRTDFDIQVNLSAGMPLQEAVCFSHDTRIVYDNESVARIALTDPTIFGGDRDFILQYRLAGKQIASGLMFYEGATENFFLLMVQPPERVTPADIPGREYIFVVDVSGSMNGFPLDTAKELLRDLIGHLRPDDTFNVVFFAGGSELLAPASLPATSRNLDRAIAMLDGQRGGGGTELRNALNRTMALPKDEGVSRSVIVVTDGYIQAETEVFETIRNNLDLANVFAFGIGSSVNRYLIEGMARAGLGEPFVVTQPAEAPETARKFREYISAPALTDIAVRFDGFQVYDLEPDAIPDLFARRPVVLFGKWRGERSGAITLAGTSGSGQYRQVFNVADTAPLEMNAALRYLWARTRIARLSDFNARKGDPENRAEIVSIGLTYNLLTDYTSFVAVDETIRNPGGESRDVTQPLPLPKGVSNLAVSGGTATVPEPEIVLLAGLSLAMAILTQRRRRS